MTLMCPYGGVEGGIVRVILKFIDTKNVSTPI